MQKLDFDPDSWRRLNRLLDEALDLPLADREAWLTTLDASHGALLPRLRDLLSRAAQVETGDFLQTLPKLITAAALETDVRGEKAGDTIGPYRLIRELGSGGMGAVWLAERTDGYINRPVALKLPHGAWRRAGLAERMAREREILATLEHPNIARLYDAGVTSEGQPFLAIEYVEGEALDEYCRNFNLDIASRLQLFVQVANAVAYAHGKLIVHRDLKPANILVTGDGQIRLLDFGIAKLVDEGGKARMTELSARALSLEYASPEQIVGKPDSVATDIYTLGVVLYELLTGERPYKLRRDSRGALEDAIVQVDPVKPSDVAEGARRRVLRGDLDTIILKALKKKPEERYATVNAFAEDINLFLASRPVTARRASGAYRFGKFVARNKLAVGAACSIAVVIIAGATIALWQARLARIESQRAEQVKNFIVSIFADADPIQTGRPAIPNAVELLKLATTRIDTLDVRPEVRIELRDVLGGSLLSVDAAPAAESVLRAAATEAVIELGPTHPRTLHARRLLVRALQIQDKVDAASAELDSLLPLLRARAKQDPAELAAGIHEAVRIASRRRQYNKAVELGTEGLALVRSNLSSPSQLEPDLLILLLGNYRQLGQHELARDAASEALAAAQALHPGEMQHPKVVEARFYHASTIARVGELQAACAEYRLIFRDIETLFGAQGRQLGLRLSATASDFVDAGYMEEALRNAKRGREILLAAYPKGNSRIEAAVAETVGRVRNASRHSEAIEQFRIAVEGFRREYGPTHETTMDVQRGLSLALAYAGRLTEARQALDEVLLHHPKIPLDRFDVAAWVGGIHERLAQNYQAGLTLQQAALASLRHPEGAFQAVDRARIKTEIALNRLGLGDYATARAELREAIATFETLQAEVTPDRADALVGLGRAELQLGNAAAALPPLQEAASFWQKFDADNRAAVEARLWLSRAKNAPRKKR